MAEISRSKAYEIAEFNLEIFGEATEMGKFIRKAISDMQKLEKIEQELNTLRNAEILVDAKYIVDNLYGILRGGE